MSKLQDLFNRIQESKKEQKSIKASYKNALSNSSQYQDIMDKIKGLKEEKRAIEDSIKDDFKKEFDTLDTLKTDIENDSMLLSDLALTMLTKGQSIEVLDEKGNKYDPLFSVKFKKNQ